MSTYLPAAAEAFWAAVEHGHPFERCLDEAIAKAFKIADVHGWEWGCKTCHDDLAKAVLGYLDALERLHNAADRADERELPEARNAVNTAEDRLRSLVR